MHQSERLERLARAPGVLGRAAGEIPITADQCAQGGKAIDLRILANFKRTRLERGYQLIVKAAEPLLESDCWKDAGL